MECSFSAAGPLADAVVELATGVGAASSAAYSAAKTEDVVVANGHAVKKRKFAHTNEAQRRCMLEWLELPGHFQLLVAPSGSAGGKLANGKKVKKTDGFRALMRHVNMHTGATWSMDITKSRFESFLTSYKKVQRQSQLPAFALTENDRARGITDVAQKCKALCLFYDRIHALFSNAIPADQLTTNEQTTGSDGRATTSLPAGADMTASILPASAMGGDRTSQDVAQVAAFKSEVENPYSTDEGLPPTPTEVRAAQSPAEGAANTASAVVGSVSTVVLTDDITLQQLALERERLDLLQEQLAVQKRELEIKERELQQQEEAKRIAVRAELAVKFAQAGKSVAEIKELLELVGSEV
jgi:hypothetical protein